MINTLARNAGRSRRVCTQPLLARTGLPHRPFFNNSKDKHNKIGNHDEKARRGLPEPPKAFPWNWLSAAYTYGLYNPFFRNTKDKLLRFFTGFRKSKEEREWERLGYFGRFVRQTQQSFYNRTQGSFEFYNPFSR